ncbi:5348_t:CDS:2, partial [Dentiscutata heterogama]
IHQYIQLLLEGQVKMDTANQIAHFIWNKESKHTKLESLIDDEDFSENCKEWLRQQKLEVHMPSNLKAYIEDTLFSKLIGHIKKDTISERMWEKEYVQITHDECYFYANDRRRRIWIQKDKNILRPKHLECSIMVDGYWKAEHMLDQLDFTGTNINDLLIDPQEGATLGTVYFAFSVTFLLWWFHEGWEKGFPRGHEYIAVAGIIAMTFGDAMASVIGKTYGRNGYQLIGAEGSRRTYEGSLAFFIVTLVMVPFFWWLMSPPELTTTEYFTGALISASVGTALESLSPWGTDNLSVPLGTINKVDKVANPE